LSLKEETTLFAVGHMAIAYLLGKGSSKTLRTKLNIPLLLVLSILPDVDIIFDFFTGTNIHRGPTHSIVVATLVFIPIFIIYRKTAIPYFLALISHSLIGDFLVGGGLKLLWPILSSQFGLHELGGPYINISGNFNQLLELTLFILATIVLYKSGDWKVFFKTKITNLVLIIPVATVLLPSIIGYPFNAPLLLTEPLLALAHLFYLGLFSVAILKTLSYLYKKWFQHSTTASQPSNRKSV
jgi:membrane-bound metal-dependent hydrolase YbcI (DUF457 family)